MLYTLAIVGASILTVLFLIPFFDTRLSEIGIVAILLLPSFCIGIPFPIILKIGAKIKYKNVIPTLLGISSVAGVSASVFAIILSILYGYKVVLLVGIGAYLLVIVGATKLKFMNKKDTSKSL